MKLIDNILYLEVDDAIECGFGNAEYISKEKSRGAKWGVFIKDPSDNRKVLIQFDTLSKRHKEKVLSVYKNPYEHFSKQPIRNMVVRDNEAEKFYLSYRYNETKSLPLEKVNTYTTAASWLNMLVKAEENKKQIKQELNLTVTEFWVKVCELIDELKIDLPSNVIRLRQKIDAYRVAAENKYQVLIHKQFGYRNAAKIDDELSEAFLLELISMPHQDDVLTCRRYNMWAEQNNKPTISESTVNNWRRKNMPLISQEKYGNRHTYNVFGKHIIRKRASAPLLCVEHDDNDLDLYYQERIIKNGRSQVYYFNRFVLAVVIDTYNDYILGWAIAKEYTKDLIRFAYLDAVYHIKELTGNYYLPHQIRSDRFGLDAKIENDLAHFYKSLATVFTPAAVKVARGKYIEQSFGKKWHQVLGCYKNNAGFNITAKTKLNEDFRDKNMKEYPTTDQAPQQIREFINVMRLLIDEKTGLSKQDEWISAFNASEKSKQHTLSETQLLVKLGTIHEYKNTITNRGITPKINCIDRTYEIPEEYYLHTIGKKVQVIYEPMDYSRILVTDNQSLLFIAREQELMPSAIADYQPGDRQKINDRLAEKVRHMRTISDAKQKRQNTLQMNRIDAESYLQAGIHSKAINQKALLNYEQPGKDYDPLDSM